MSNFFDFREQLPELYSKILAIAEVELRNKEQPHHSWRPSDLVNETLLKLFESETTPESFQCDWVFYSYVGTVMHRLLINYGIQKRAQKRGGGMVRQYIETLEELEFKRVEFDLERYLEVGSLLERLGEQDPREAEIFRMRWYSGMSVARIAKGLNLSERTIQAELQAAMAWIKKEAKKLN